MEKPARMILPERDAAGTLRPPAGAHIGFAVPDVETTADFYGRVLGLLVQQELPGGGLQLGWGAGHHVLDLVEGDPALLHYGFEVRDPDGIQGISKRLTAVGHTVEPLPDLFLDAAAGSPTGVTVSDPDGTRVHFHS